MVACVCWPKLHVESVLQFLSGDTENTHFCCKLPSLPGTDNSLYSTRCLWGDKTHTHRHKHFLAILVFESLWGHRHHPAPCPDNPKQSNSTLKLWRPAEMAPLCKTCPYFASRINILVRILFKDKHINTHTHTKLQCHWKQTSRTKCDVSLCQRLSSAWALSEGPSLLHGSQARCCTSVNAQSTSPQSDWLCL